MGTVEKTVGEGTPVPRGDSLTLPQCWQLAQEWYADRLSPDWRSKTIAEAQTAFARIGLTGEFWKLDSEL